MYEGKETKEEQNFWVSYADLMAGLLFVFILVLGAIVIKYVYVQENLEIITTDLVEKRAELEVSNGILILKNEALNKSNDELFKKKKAFNQLDSEVKKLKAILIRTQNTLELKEGSNTLMSMNLEDKEKLLKNNIKKIKLKENEVLVLTDLLSKKEKSHKLLFDEFSATKNKIKNLIGIRVKVISALKEKLGKSINIDKHSGAIKFSSSILFDQGKYTLKEEAKEQLSEILKAYVHTLLLDKDIKKYIDDITIEGHTNSDGSYLYNLELSQQRSFEVMKFIYSLNLIDKSLLRKYIDSSGRSYSQRIYDKNGTENKDASRRIEIKFRIKNEQSIKQLSKYLELQ